MNIQYLIFGAIVIAAGIYLVRSFIKSAKGHACESGKCGCKPGDTIKN